MKEQLLTLLAAKFVGVDNAILGRIADKLAKTATTADEAQTAVDGVDFQYVLKSYGDSRATEASETSVRNYERKHNIKDGTKLTDVPPVTSTPSNNDTPEWARELIESNKALTEKVQTLEQDKIKLSKEEKQRTALSKSVKLPEFIQKKWAGRIDVDSETTIESQVEALEAEYSELHSTFIAGSSGKGLPVGGGNNGEASDDEVKEILDKM